MPRSGGRLAIRGNQGRGKIGLIGGRGGGEKESIKHWRWEEMRSCFGTDLVYGGWREGGKQWNLKNI